MKTTLIATSGVLSLGAVLMLLVSQTTTALILAVCALLVLLLLPTAKARQQATAEQGSVDFDQTRTVRERKGRIAAVRDIRHQDPALSLVEATHSVDAL